ncbi:hypothetical protein BHM03_00015039 [Ensete ventricosum]|nr:hypothetical protein BHM03_00015039 [Ensete ventricosum]
MKGVQAGVEMLLLRLAMSWEGHPPQGRQALSTPVTLAALLLASNVMGAPPRLGSQHNEIRGMAEGKTGLDEGEAFQKVRHRIADQSKTKELLTKQAAQTKEILSKQAVKIAKQAEEHERIIFKVLLLSTFVSPFVVLKGWIFSPYLVLLDTQVTHLLGVLGFGAFCFILGASKLLSVSWELSKKAQKANNIWWRLSGLLGDKNRQIMYILLQAVFTVATMALAVPIFMSYKMHVTFQIFKVSAITWNGGSFILDVIPKQAVLREKKKLEMKPIVEEPDGPSADLSTSSHANSGESSGM